MKSIINNNIVDGKYVKMFSNFAATTDEVLNALRFYSTTVKFKDQLLYIVTKGKVNSITSFFQHEILVGWHCPPVIVRKLTFYNFRYLRKVMSCYQVLGKLIKSIICNTQKL